MATMSWSYFARRRPLTAIGAVLVLLVAAVGPVASAQALQSRLEGLIRGSDLGETRVAVMVLDLDRHELLVAIDPDAAMIPASNMKLVTTAAALDVLGAEHVFRTELALTPATATTTPATPATATASAAVGGGAIDGGAAAGGAYPSLVITGDGDPAFGDPDLLARHQPPLAVDDLLARWVEVVKATGHARFDRLIVDDRVLDREFVHASWPTDQLINRWAAPVAGLNFYRNTIDVMAQPDPSGGSPIVEIFPAAPFLQTRNRARTGDRDAFWISRSPGSDIFTFHGTVRQRGTAPVEVTVHDPPIFLANVLRHELGEAGIAVGAVVRHDELDAELADRMPLHAVQTTLPLVLMRTNQDSQNMFAEALIKRMGHAVTGEAGSWENGAAAIRMAMRQRLGPSSAAISIADGSGLSRDNRVTTRALVELLRSMHEDEHRGRIWRQTLAHAGHSGTLRNRMQSIDGEVYGKTGYIRGVSALSGYLVLPATDDGPPRTIAFSFLFNGFEPPLRNAHMRDLQDAMVEAIHEHLAARR
ncbi:MAG: D-alanyl-D-alanine carboxypeptidase/D-alanyl-D-alanine-endopeptidase [Phycisphaeraceae bacterium]